MNDYLIDREAYQERFCLMLKNLGYDSYGFREGATPGDPFTVRMYYWGDDDEVALLPNFECPEIGLKIKWYKYPLRGATSNIPFTEDIMSKLELIANRATGGQT